MLTTHNLFIPHTVRIIRLCNNDCTVKGIPIKKGSVVVSSTHKMHYREDLWSEPDTFNPDRYL